jgi:hypothetical protein
MRKSRAQRVMSGCLAWRNRRKLRTITQSIEFLAAAAVMCLGRMSPTSDQAKNGGQG